MSQMHQIRFPAFVCPSASPFVKRHLIETDGRTDGQTVCPSVRPSLRWR